MRTIEIAIGAMVAIVVIIITLYYFFMRDTGRHSDARVMDELNERPFQPTTDPIEDTIAGYQATQIWWRVRALDIQSEIVRDEEYWQRLIDGQKLSDAQWLRRENAA